MKIYIVMRVGIYRQEILFSSQSLGWAKEKAKILILEEKDDYHEMEVSSTNLEKNGQAKVIGRWVRWDKYKDSSANHRKIISSEVKWSDSE